MLPQDLLIIMRTVLRSAIRVMDAALGGERNALSAMRSMIPRAFNARIAGSRFIRLLTAQPTTRRECKSRIIAR